MTIEFIKAFIFEGKYFKEGVILEASEETAKLLLQQGVAKERKSAAAESGETLEQDDSP